MSDYYQILQIPKTATDTEIRQAYRNLALKWHPDKNPANQAEANAKFKELSNAYEILSNPAKRREYDQGRAIAVQGHSAGTFPFGRGHGVYVFRNPEDIFQDFFQDFGTLMNFGSGGGVQIFSNSMGNYGSGGYYSCSTITSTVIQNGRKVTTKTTVTNGVTVTEVFENDCLVSSITRNG